MSDSQSGRPLTSEPRTSEDSSSSNEPPSEVNTPESIKANPFVPNVFDFVFAGHLVSRVTPLRIPPVLLEPQTIDSSTFIGQGASFTTFRRQVPPIPPRRHMTSFGGLRIVTHSSQEKRPIWIVYKVARIDFTAAGEPTVSTRSAARAVLMELYALTHPPLANHPNIISLLGLAWGSNRYNNTHKLPIAVVEYADHGSLADLQSKISLSSDMRLNLCLDIAQGIQILHRTGIVHGDVKSENILVFSHPQKQFIAKVADFGFSVVGRASGTAMHIPGTKPWKAPEADGPVARELLKQTDIYSFGLLVWRVALDGHDPFALYVKPFPENDKYFSEVERLKKEDRLLTISRTENWLLHYLSHPLPGVPEDGNEASISDSVGNIQHLISSLQNEQGRQWDVGRILALLRGKGVAQLSQQTPSVMLNPTLLQALLQSLLQALLPALNVDPFYGKLPNIALHTLEKDPLSRKLDAAITVLKGQSISVGSTLEVAENSAFYLTSPLSRHWLSWQQIGDLNPTVQTFIFLQHISREESANKVGRSLPDSRFILAAQYINGYGTEVDHEAAKRFILHAARNGGSPYSAYTYRICRAFDGWFILEPGLVTKLISAALDGSRQALQDVPYVAPPAMQSNIRLILRNVLAGVGAPFYTKLTAGSYARWMDILDGKKSRAIEAPALDTAVGFSVTKRGDRLLHMAAACGKDGCLKLLLDSFPKLSVNQLNDAGETPLLCACRAGQTRAVRSLIDRGADASISTMRGESPLHWLVSFDDVDVETIGQVLIANGGRKTLRLQTTTPIDYSQFNTPVEGQYQPPGSPLNWAVVWDRPVVVNFLINTAEDPQICLDRIGKFPTPIQRAAVFHNLDCFKPMIDLFKRKKCGFTYVDYIESAVHGADEFSMISRNGLAYKERFEAMFDYFVLETRNIVFSTGIGGHNLSLLYLAISKARDLVVDYLLSPKTAALLKENEKWFQESSPDAGFTRLGALHSQGDIDRACGDDRRTPLLEAIRWNRKHVVKLLLQEGANILANSCNPFHKDIDDWGALHVFAQAGHDIDTSMVHELVSAGAPVDGTRSVDTLGSESPFLVAIQNNTFRLATELLDHAANINYLSRISGLMLFEYPTTVLGHIISSAAQQSGPRVKYLLFNSKRSAHVDFIVEPERKLTALHRTAWADHGISSYSPEPSGSIPLQREDYDMANNREILSLLLERYQSPVELDQKCAVHGRTALHLAVEAGNRSAVQLLLDRRADPSILDDQGLTPLSLGIALLEDVERKKDRARIEEAVSLLR